MTQRIGLSTLLVLIYSLASPAGNAASLPEKIIPVPIVTQATPYSCGAAAVLSTLYYWQAYDGNESSLYGPLETTPKDGTVPEKMAEVARAHGVKAEIREHQSLNDLRAALAAGDTVIVEYQAWRDVKAPKLPWKDTWEEGHYSVLVGLDGINLFFMDPSAHKGYGYIPEAEFLDRWHDYDVYQGAPVRHFQLGIFIHGKKPLGKFPGLLRIE